MLWLRSRFVLCVPTSDTCIEYVLSENATEKKSGRVKKRVRTRVRQPHTALLKFDFKRVHHPELLSFFESHHMHAIHQFF